MTSHAQQKTRHIARLHRLRGQLEALERALNDDRDASKVLHQMAAVRGAINGLIANFIADCVRLMPATRGAVTDTAAPGRGVAHIDDAIRTYLR